MATENGEGNIIKNGGGDVNNNDNDELLVALVG